MSMDAMTSTFSIIVSKYQVKYFTNKMHVNTSTYDYTRD